MYSDNEQAQKMAVALRRGESMVEKGRYRAALRHFESLLKSVEPDDLESMASIKSRIADVYYRRSQLSFAGNTGQKGIQLGITRLEQAIQYDDRNAVYFTELGRRRAQIGKIEEANEAFDAALALEAPAETLLFEAAVIKILINDYHRAHDLILNGLDKSMKGQGISRGWWVRLRVFNELQAGHIEEAVNLSQTPFEGVPRSVWLDDFTSIVLASNASDNVASRVDAAIKWLENEANFAGDGALANLYEMLGDIFFVIDDPEKACTNWLTAHARRPDRKLEEKIGSLCAREATKHFAAQAFDDAKAWCTKAVHLKACESRLSRILSVILLTEGADAWDHGNVDAAMAAWKQSTKWKKTFEGLWNQAVATELQQDWSRAARLWSEVDRASESLTSREPFNTNRRRGFSLALAGEFAESAQAFRRSLEVEADVDAFVMAGYTSLVSGEYNDALTILKRGNDEVGDVPELVFALAVASDLAAETPENRERYWRKAAAAFGDEKTKQTWRQRAIQYGRRLARGKDFVRAMRVFAELLLNNPDDAECWMWCCIIHQLEGRDDRATDCLEKALANTPNPADAYAQIGAQLMAVGQASKAQKYLEHASKTGPSLAIELNIAEMYLQVQNMNLAFSHLKRIVKASRRGSKELVDAVRLAVSSGHSEWLLSLLDEVSRVTGTPHIIKLLMAAQRVRRLEWQQASEALDQCLAYTKELPVLEKYIEYFRRSMILLMTVGDVDRSEFDRHERELVDLWAEREVPKTSSTSESEDWLEIVRVKLLEKAQQERSLQIIKLDSGVVNDKHEEERPEFGRPINVMQRLSIKPA